MNQSMQWPALRQAAFVVYPILIFSLFCGPVFPQKGTVIFPDSVSQNLKQLRKPIQKIEYLHGLIEHSSILQPQLAIRYSEEAISIAQKARLNPAYAKSLYWKAWIRNRESPESIDLETVLADAQISASIFTEEKMPFWLAKAQNLIASIYYNLYKYTEAQKYNQLAQRSLKSLFEKDKTIVVLQADINRTFGNLAYAYSEWDSCLTYYEKSQADYLFSGESLKQARVLLNKAFVFDLINQIDSSLASYKEAIRIYEKNGSKEDRAKAYLEYATFQANRFMATQDSGWLLQSNKQLKSILAIAPQQISEVYYQLGANFQNYARIHRNTNPDFYFFLLDSAFFYQEKVLHEAVKENNLNYVMLSANTVAQLCPDIPLKYCTSLLQEVDTAYQAILKANINAVNQANEKIQKFERDLTTSQRQKLLGLGGLILLGLTAGFLFVYQRSRIKLLKKILNNRMQTNRAQMNPHFISNCLNAIDSLINKGQNDNASNYIIEFGRLCRLVITNSKHQFIPLENEVETLKYYLSLEKLRLGEMLEYSILVDPNINQSETSVPPSLLQPFVENSIQHGIQMKQAPGKILIEIKKIKSNVLECIVEDDGIGRQKARAFQEKSVLKHKGVGLSNSRELIESFRKGKSAKIEITDLYDKAGKASGTRVCIHLPIITIQNTLN